MLGVVDRRKKGVKKKKTAASVEGSGRLVVSYVRLTLR